jgi:nucleoside 2-deoxyribosyltransferase
VRKHADMLLNAVIREALEGSDPPYEIVRSDKVAEPGMINDRVIHDILNADLVVADLTFLNANAFYELGLRHAALKPVINFAQLGTKLPFDTFGYRAIMEDITSWDGIQRARQQIQEQAKVTEAEGYRVSNPITQANASFKMRESADPQEHYSRGTSETKSSRAAGIAWNRRSSSILH